MQPHELKDKVHALMETTAAFLVVFLGIPMPVAMVLLYVVVPIITFLAMGIIIYRFFFGH